MNGISKRYLPWGWELIIGPGAVYLCRPERPARWIRLWRR